MCVCEARGHLSVYVKKKKHKKADRCVASIQANPAAAVILLLCSLQVMMRSVKAGLRLTTPRLTFVLNVLTPLFKAATKKKADGSLSEYKLSPSPLGREQTPADITGPSYHDRYLVTVISSSATQSTGRGVAGEILRALPPRLLLRFRHSWRDRSRRGCIIALP